ncbi:MAG: 6-bladed beta-propeller [Bacteroidales bacterium]|nr:6-bladed beta-propeller [Bacteroidales bacterium]MDD4669835.1 6-bladed beta-propeller [Bacteroidales bacterium]
MNKNYFSAIVACVAIAIVSSCSGDKDGSVGVIDIEKGLDNVVSVNLSDYASSLSYYSLESDSVLLPAINRSTVVDGNVILTNLRSTTLYVYSNDGKYIKNLGEKGRARNEYSVAGQLIPEPDSKCLTVWSGDKIVTYSIETGEFVRALVVDEIKGFDCGFFGSTVYLGDGNYAIESLDKEANAENETLVYVDSCGNVTGSVQLPPPYNSLVQLTKTQVVPNPIKCTIYEYKGAVNVIPGKCDTIFTISDDMLRPKYVFDYGSLESIGTAKVISDKTFSVGRKYFECDNFILFDANLPASYTIYPDSRRVYMIYDKNTKRTSTAEYSDKYKMAGFTNDIDRGMPFMPDMVVDGKMYQFVDAISFIEAAALTDAPEIKRIAQTLTETSNPVMIVATLK